MRHLQDAGQFPLELLDVRSEHEPSGVADSVEGRPHLLAKHCVLPVEGEERHGGKEIGGPGGRPVGRCWRRGGGGADHGEGISEAGVTTGLRPNLSPAIECSGFEIVMIGTSAPDNSVTTQSRRGGFVHDSVARAFVGVVAGGIAAFPGGCSITCHRETGEIGESSKPTQGHGSGEKSGALGGPAEMLFETEV